MALLLQVPCTTRRATVTPHANVCLALYKKETLKLIQKIHSNNVQVYCR